MKKLSIRLKKLAKSGDKESRARFELLEGVQKEFNDGKSARVQKLDAEIVDEYQFLTGKPLLYVANTDEENSSPELVDALSERAKNEGAGIVVLCTKLESEIVDLPEEERDAYYEEAGIVTPGLSKLAKAGRELLNLVCFFTSGEQETRAWLIPNGTLAPKAAGKIHTDIERGFIRAEIYKCVDLEQNDSYQNLQSKGLVALEGKEYQMQDGDVVHFRFSV